jgi:dihydroorotate dehydrogenase electron transfer subunit
VQPIPQLNLPKLTLPTAFTVQRVESENYRTLTIVLDGQLDAYPGQFVMAWLPRFDEKPFSLVNANPITLMVTAVGPFSRLLHELQPADRLWLRGPFGHGYQRPPNQQRIALVGGGYGVAPLLWLAQSALPEVEQITAVIGARTGVDLLYVHRFEALARQHSNLTLITTTEDGSAGLPGRVTDALLPLAAIHALDGIYACGPHGMLAALQALGAQYAIPCQLSWEAYMRCGIGICGACEHAGQVLCLEGPVLNHPAPRIAQQ